jgi:hypothetical protein
MKWSAGFTELVLHFAERMGDAKQMPMEEALLTSTPLYLNLGLNRSFDGSHPIWQEFVRGFRHTSDPVSWSHDFYAAHGREYPTTAYGCFSYHFERETQTIRFHFGNRDPSAFGPLTDERRAARRQELIAMFSDIRRDVPEARAVRGRSWMYHLPAYCRLFPPEYVRSTVPAPPELQFMSLWGQFLDRSWELRVDAASKFRERFMATHVGGELISSFPLSVLALSCSIDHFYAFFGVNGHG